MEAQVIKILNAEKTHTWLVESMLSVQLSRRFLHFHDKKCMEGEVRVESKRHFRLPFDQDCEVTHRGPNSTHINY